MTIPTLLASYSSGPVKESKVVPVRTAATKRPTPKIEKKVEAEKLAPEKKPVFTVEVIKGSKFSEVKFEGGE